MTQAGGDGVEDQNNSLEDMALDAVSTDEAVPGVSGDGDGDNDGGPYEPVTVYCDRLKLGVPGRIRVFQALCLAVHKTHQRGLIFGDLSASRLTVAAEGEPAVPASRAEETDSLDEFSSPERVLGEPPTIGDDVYALGVSLYELLTGRRPYQVDPEDPSALAKAISEQAPERPSRSAPGLRKTLGGDLDLIVLHALHKEPERRYASAAALADDLDQYLAGLPVRAHRPSELYRVGTFLKRRKWVAPVVVALVLGVIAGAAAGVQQYRKVRRERDLAERLYQSARDVVAQNLARLTNDSAAAGVDADDPDALRRDLLAGLSQYYQEFLDANAGSADLAALAEARTRTAAIARAMGRKQEAASQFQNAVELWKYLIAHNPDDPRHPERLAESYAELGRALDSKAKAEGPEADEALEAFASARSLLTPLADARPEARELRRELARVLRDEAEIQYRRRATSALGSIRQALRLQEELSWEEPADLDARLALASGYGLLSRIETDREDGWKGATLALERAVDVLSTAPDAADPPPRLAFDLARRLSDLAALQAMSGEMQPAAVHATRAAGLLEKLAVRFPANAAYRAELASIYNILVELRRDRGERTEALELARKTQGLLDRLMIEQPDKPSHAIDLAMTQQLIGRLLGQAKQNTQALQAFRRAIDLLEGQKDLDGQSCYALACNLSLGLTLVGAKDGSPPLDDDDPTLKPADKVRRKVYADRAVAVLRQAVAKGVNRLDVYRTDPALDSLRSRDDFKKLLADLAAPPT